MPVDNALHKAAHKGDFEECQKYIDGCPEEDIDAIDVNDPGAADRRALHRSAGAGHLELSKYFLDKGALIDLADKNGRTALHWAAISGHTEVVKMLLQKGCNVLALTTSKMNALQGACEGGRVETVHAIMEFVSTDEALKRELTMNKNEDGKTAWDIVSTAKNTPLCQILKDMGDTNAQSSSCLIS